MARHPFDPVPFVFGALALTSGVVVLAGGSLTHEARLLLPAGLIGLGIALLVKVGGRRAELTPAAAPMSPGGDAPMSEDDIDRLFAPVDEVLSQWDAGDTSPGTGDDDDTLSHADDTLIGGGSDDDTLSPEDDTPPAADYDDTLTRPDTVTDSEPPAADPGDPPSGRG